jgi:aminopeptidase N
LDLAGLPDFSAGAMENWGLMTFREQVLYVDPKHSSVDTKQFSAMIIGHEIAHMWFGNLVTMKWWTDLWLNESFANLMEYRVVDALYPEWRIWEEFAYRETGSALARDALPNVQAVRTEVNHPDELSTLFDPSIAYAKGGNLLNMVRNLIGEDSFRAGLGTYFEQHQYSNTEANDLWKHLGKASGTDIKAIMQNWLNKPGYPVVAVDYRPGAKSFSAGQERLIVGNSPARASTIWRIPLAASQELDKPMLEAAHDNFRLKPTSDHPLLLNHEGLSYFVSQYLNPDHFQSILDGIKAGQVSPIDRLLLVQSYLLLERAGRVGTVDNLKLLKAFAGEREEAVWGILSGVIGNVRLLIGVDEELEMKFNRFLQPIIAPLLDYTGWDAKQAETSQMKKMRTLATGLGAGAQIKEVIDEGLARFKKFKRPSDLAPDTRSTIYIIAVRHGSSQDFEKLLKAYKTETNAELKEEIGASLSATKDPKKSGRLLSMIKLSEVRAQDIPAWFAWILRNKYSTDLAWAWLKENWQWVESKFGDDKSYDRFPRYSAMVFSRPEQLRDYKRFFESKSSVALDRAINLGVEEIDGRIAWRAKNESDVKDWLKSVR